MVITIPCLADTSFLSNFVFTGNAVLLQKALRAPVYLTPVVLDPEEPLGAEFLLEQPQSEILRPLFVARQQQNSKYKNAELPLETFIAGRETLWRSVALTADEERLALSYRNGNIWRSCPGSKRLTGLDPGEAETIAVAISRQWSLLIDDQAGVELVKALCPQLQIVRTCQFLVRAVEKNLLQCESAEDLFNSQICGQWGFYAKRPGQKKYLRFRCNPPRCEWE